MTNIAELNNDKNGSNPLETGSDRVKAANALDEIAREEGTTRAHHLLSAFSLLVAKSTEEQVDKGFSAVELVEAVQNSGLTSEWDWLPSEGPDQERARKLVNKQWKALLSRLDQKRRKWNEKLKVKEVELTPNLYRVDGRPGGEAHTYFLKFSESQADDIHKVEFLADVPPNGIRYYTEEIKRSENGWWARTGIILLTGRTKRIFSAVVLTAYIVAILLIVFISFGVLFASTAVKAITSLVSLGIVGSGLWFLFFKSFLDLLNNRITLIPFVMHKSTDANPIDRRLLELRWNDDASANGIYLTRYSSKCPLCEGKINIVSGRRDFPGRLVGRCDNNPNEHVYSFDHILRVGKPLR